VAGLVESRDDDWHRGTSGNGLQVYDKRPLPLVTGGRQAERE
jgi:hypothetical protein